MSFALPIYDNERFNEKKVCQRGESFLQKETNCKNAVPCAEACWQNTNISILSGPEKTIDNYEAYYWTSYKRSIVRHVKACSICDKQNISIDSSENPDSLLSEANHQQSQTIQIAEKLLLVEGFYNSLSSEDKDFFEMAFYNRLSGKELASVFNIEEATARQRCLRLKRRCVEFCETETLR